MDVKQKQYMVSSLLISINHILQKLHLKVHYFKNPNLLNALIQLSLLSGAKYFFLFWYIISEYMLLNIFLPIGNLEVGNTENNDNDKNTGTKMK